ncbi:MAG: metal ABC transporter ATP-binding protein [Myxococcota bacterium]|jgi:ABC-type Mn2+/Zn2+ transport system ATPase subunit
MNEDMGLLVKLENVEIGYGRALMRPLSLSIGKGEWWGVVGPNGAGKTTLVRTMLGLVPAVSGKVEYPSGRPRFGYVPQRHSLNPAFPLTVFDVVLMGRYPGLKTGRAPDNKDRDLAMKAVARAGLQDQTFQKYSALSGGQQQRALMARALTADPDLLVLDEPTAGMDLSGEADILQFLSELHAVDGLTIIMIGHYLETVARVVNHLCLINKDTGQFEAGASCDLVQPDKLSALYGRLITVSGACGGLSIAVGGDRDG